MLPVSRLNLRAKRQNKFVPWALAGFAVFSGLWAASGASVLAQLNPQLHHELALAAHPALDAWITPPKSVDLPPLVISTPASLQHTDHRLTVAEGSTISAHLAEQDGDAPQLVIDGNAEDFIVDAHGDFSAAKTLQDAHKIEIRRDGRTIGAWRVTVKPDSPPELVLTQPMVLTAGKLQVSYRASDDVGLTALKARIALLHPQPGMRSAFIDVPLKQDDSKQAKGTSLLDMNTHPWMGQDISVQLIAVNAAGKTSATDPVDIKLPERLFAHPVSRVLLEERKKLLTRPTDQMLREETANIMAALAHEAATHHSDALVAMALRSGAVRLILDDSLQSAQSVNDMLWRIAVRVEEGAADNDIKWLKDAQQDLARGLLILKDPDI